jgi:hypothetical protein
MLGRKMYLPADWISQVQIFFLVRLRGMTYLPASKMERGLALVVLNYKATK